MTTMTTEQHRALATAADACRDAGTVAGVAAAKLAHVIDRDGDGLNVPYVLEAIAEGEEHLRRARAALTA